MGADLTADRTYLQGLLIQDPRLVAGNIDETLTTATQAEPTHGHAIAQQDTDLVLNAHGSQSADKKLRAYLQRAGYPGTDEASTLWYEDGDPIRDYRGWDPPLTISDFEIIDVEAVADTWQTPDAVVCDSGKIVFAIQELDTSGPSNVHKISVWVRTPATATTAASWAKTEVFNRGGLMTDGAHPCLVKLDSGQLRLFFWYRADGGNLTIIRMYHSDDDGSTWGVGQYNSGAEIITVSANVDRLRAVEFNSQLLLVAAIYQSGASPKHQLRQYASDDLGATFSLISQLNTGNSRCRSVLLKMRERVIVAYIGYEGSTEAPYVRVLGSAHESLASATPILADDTGNAHWGVVSSDEFTEAELAGYVDEDDVLYLFGLDYRNAGDRELIVRRSTDGGESWSTPGTSAANHAGACPWITGDDSYHPRDFTAVAWRGCGVLIHRGTAAQEAEIDVGESLMCTFLGGMTSVCMPPLSTLSGHEMTRRASFSHTWLAWMRPDDLSAYTITLSTPAPTISTSTSGIVVSHTNTAHTAAWQQTLAGGAGNLTKGAIYLYEVVHTGDGSLHSEGWVSVSDGTSVSIGIGIRIDGTSLEIYNAPAGTLTGGVLSTVSTAIALNGGLQVLLAVQQDSDGNNIGRVYYRPPGPTDRKWTPTSSTPLVLTAGSATNGFAGVRTNSNVTSGSATFKLACLGAEDTGVHIVYDQTIEQKLGRTVMPTPVWIDDGLSLSASDGPGVHGDLWHIDTRYGFPVSNTDPRTAPSPRNGHRTVDDDADAEIGWTLGVNTSDEHAPMGAMLGIYFGEINWRLAELWTRSGGSWTKRGDIDTATGMSGLAFNRYGQAILPDLSAGLSADRYFLEHILAGSTFDFGDGVTTPRKITTNTAGAWTLASTGTVNPPRILLDRNTYATSDPTSGSGARIWSKDALVLLPLSYGDSFDAVKVIIKTQATAEGDLRTGVMMPGWFLAFGQPYAAGRAATLSPNVQMTTGRNGIRTVRPLGPNRRAMEFDWTDGVWSADLGSTLPNPDIIRAFSNGPVLATPASVPWDMMGAYERARGAVDPVVYAAGVPVQAGPIAVVQTLTDPRRFLYGRLVSESMRIDTAAGDEWSSANPEYVRVNTTTVEAET